MEEPGFWDEPEKSQEIMKELKGLKDQVDTIRGLYTSYEDIGLLIEMAYEEEDASILPEIEEELAAFEEAYETLRIQTLLSGEYDKYNAIVTLHAGAGGTESCDWAAMLCICREKGIRFSDVGLSGRGYCRNQGGDF